MDLNKSECENILYLHFFKIIFKTIGFIFIGRRRWKVTSSKLIIFSNISVKYESKWKQKVI